MRRGQQGKKEGNRMMIMMNFILDAYNNGGRSRFACRTVSKLGSRTKLKYSMDRERVGGGSRRNHQQQQRLLQLLQCIVRTLVSV